MINSCVAFGNGGVFGRGLGNSIQKLGYLPEAHTDFILAIIAEELGFVGVPICCNIIASYYWESNIFWYKIKKYILCDVFFRICKFINSPRSS